MMALLSHSTMAQFDSNINLTDLNGSNCFKINGAMERDQSGWSVSHAGDVNGDGIDGIIIGAWGANPIGISSGSSYVVFGSASDFTPTVELSSLNGNNGFTINGVADGDQSGISTSYAGDVNNDGIDDVIIGAPASGPNGISGAGSSYIVFGSNSGFTPTVELASLDGSNGFTINGVSISDFSGESVSHAGDVNGDGIDDVIIGAWAADPDGNTVAGNSYVVFGNSNGFTPTIELSSLNGSNGFTINGVTTLDQSGWSVSHAGDVNGDGIDDVIIGASNADPNGNSSGSSYIVFGSKKVFTSSVKLSSLNGSNGFTVNGVSAGDQSGWSVSRAGDVNGDGIDDLIIGARGADPNGTSSGSSYVVFGNNNGFTPTIELSSLNGINGFTIRGSGIGDRSGWSVSYAGDVNGDDIDDIIIGADRADENGTSSGSSYVVFGNNIGFTPTIDLSSLNGSNGFTLSGVTNGDQSGWSVSHAGDVNGDGIDDVIIGAPGADSDDNFSTGISYVVFGKEKPIFKNGFE